MRHPQKTELEFASFHLMMVLVSPWLIVRTISQYAQASSAIYNLWTNIELSLDPPKLKEKEYMCVMVAVGEGFESEGFYGEYVGAEQ